MNAGALLDELRNFRLHADAHVAVEDELDIDGATIPRITSEYWTKRQRQGHSLHELSYRACFKSELPRFFIERLTAPGDVVLDPFMGRGTTLLEAALHGRAPWGNDVNPLSRILVEPRLEPPAFDEISHRVASLDLSDPGAEPGEPDLSAFYHEETLGAIRALRGRFCAVPSGELDTTDRWLRMVATNRLTGHSPGFFSGRTMPPNQAVSLEVQQKLNEKHGLVPPRRDVPRILLRKSKSLLRDYDMFTLPVLRSVQHARKFLSGDARDLHDVEAESVRLVVTSPPFLDVIDYAADNWLRCWFNGLDADAIGSQITCPSRVNEWQDFVREVLVELARVLQPGGWIVFEVGEVRGGRVRLEELVLPAARAAELRPVAVAVNSQDFTKTANCWGVTNNSKGTNTNRLVLLQKGE